MGNDTGRKMTLLGYHEDKMEFAVACNHPNGVVLSIDDKRVELTTAQFMCLYDLMKQFINSETEL